MLQHLWRHVEGRANACRGHRLVLHRRDTKVRDLALPCTVHKEVLRLEVSMQHVAAVQVIPTVAVRTHNRVMGR